MPLCVQELARRQLSFPVLVGGAAINRQYGLRILFVDEDKPYQPGVFYCKDAFEGLETMDRLIVPEERARLLEQTYNDACAVLEKAQTGRMVMADVGRTQGSSVQQSTIRRDVPIPTPPFWGSQVLTRVPMDELFDCIDYNAMYRLQWGAKNAKGEKWQQLQAEFGQLVRELRREGEREGWLETRIAYGFFPVQSEGNDLIVYDPQEYAATKSSSNGKRPAELVRFTFPRQPKGEYLCLSDYYASTESGRMDVAAFQIVTVGDKITELCERLQAEGNYSRAYYVHGLGVSLAEGLAEYTNRLVRRGLGLSGEQGLRYSWGYPACPDLEDHVKLFQLLPTEQIGTTLTSAYQLIPEQSTAAIVVHHPDAKYFSIGSTLERAEVDVVAP